jgi:hypothetical protein
MFYDDPRLATHATVYHMNADAHKRSQTLQFDQFQANHKQEIEQKMMEQHRQHMASTGVQQITPSHHPPYYTQLQTPTTTTQAPAYLQPSAPQM